MVESRIFYDASVEPGRTDLENGDVNFIPSSMTYITSWEEFAKAAERLYLSDPLKVRFVMKYRHCSGLLCIKITDDQVCIQYRTEHAQDVKKIEKLTSQLMRHMASKDTHH